MKTNNIQLKKIARRGLKTKVLKKERKQANMNKNGKRKKRKERNIK